MTFTGPIACSSIAHPVLSNKACMAVRLNSCRSIGCLTYAAIFRLARGGACKLLRKGGQAERRRNSTNTPETDHYLAGAIVLDRPPLRLLKTAICATGGRPGRSPLQNHAISTLEGMRPSASRFPRNTCVPFHVARYGRPCSAMRAGRRGQHPLHPHSPTIHLTANCPQPAHITRERPVSAVGPP